MQLETIYALRDHLQQINQELLSPQSYAEMIVQLRRQSELSQQLSRALEQLGAELVDQVIAGTAVEWVKATMPGADRVHEPRRMKIVERRIVEEARPVPEAAAARHPKKLTGGLVISDLVASPSPTVAAPPVASENSDSERFTPFDSIVTSTPVPPVAHKDDARIVANPTPVNAPPPVPVTADVLQRLKGMMSSSAQASTSQSSVRIVTSRTLDGEARTIVQRSIEALGTTPAHLRGKKPARREVERLLQVVAQEIGHWAAAGAPANLALTSWVTARGRAAQAACEKEGERELLQSMNDFFPTLTHHSGETRPGAVHGLARRHEPETGDWLQDARKHEQALMNLLGDLSGFQEQADAPEQKRNFDNDLRQLTEEVREGLTAEQFATRVAALLEAGLSASETRLVRLSLPFAGDLLDARFAHLRKAIARTVEAEEETQVVALVNPLPENWPLYPVVRNKRVVIVGGDPRPERASRLRDIFGFASVEWLENATGGTRQVDTLAQRMRSGNVDMVIVLRAFSSHTISEKIFAVDAPLCTKILADTYGVTQVQLGLERFLRAPAERS